MSDTIRSRTQHLQFHLLPADTLAEHIRWVATDAGLDVSEASLEQALSRGGGSARDTLSALELLANTGDEGMEVVPLDEFVESMIDRDSGRALTVIAHAITSGMDPRTLTEELIAFLRNGFLALMAPELVQVPSNRLDALASQAQRLGAAGLVRGIEFLGAALSEMRHAPDPRVLLDVATVQLTADSVGGDTAALLQRLERLERQVAAGVAAPVGAEGASAASIRRPAERRSAVVPRSGSAAPRRRRCSRCGADGRTRCRRLRLAAPEAPVAAPVSPAGPSNAGGSSADTAASTPASPTVISADVWENTIRPALRGMARAVYAPAGFVAGTASTLTLSVPNAVHLAKCEEQRSVVETRSPSSPGRRFEWNWSTAMATVNAVPVRRAMPHQLVRPFRRRCGVDTARGIRRRLDAGDDAGPASARDDQASRRRADTNAGAKPVSSAMLESGIELSASTPRTRGLAAAAASAQSDGPFPDERPMPAVELPDDDEVDLDDLIDAPPESVKSPIDRLAEAFPGSELIEEAG